MHTGNHQRWFLGGLQLAGLAIITGLLTLSPVPAKAAPFTTNFVALITDLQGRAAALSNSTDKVSEKQFKTIEKILTTFEKPSTSEATDIKTLGSVGKTLIKSFPTDFTPPGSSLLTNLNSAIAGFTNNAQRYISIVQTDIDEIAESSCKTKSQTTLSDAQEFLDQVATASSFATQAKLISSAWKDTLKADASTTKCAGTTGGGGGGSSTGDFVRATIMGAFNNSFDTSFLPPTAAADTNGFILSIVASEAAFGGTAMDFVTHNVSTNGTYPLDISSDLHRTSPNETYFIGTNGTGFVTFTTLDIPGRKLAGSFFYTCSTTDAVPKSVTITNGTFSVSHISIIP